jgi:hypothetical protein
MKTLKITIGLILLIGVVQNVFSQQIKTYQGKYEEGSAIYQYFEDENYERIYQGNFKYTADYVTVIGQYDKNKRVGKWTITKTPPDMTIFGKHLEGYKEIVTGNYLNGELDGLWTLIRNNEKTKKEILRSSATFKEGYLVGSFIYNDKDFTLNNNETINLSLTGNFDQNGNFDSLWVADYKKDGIPFEKIRKFKDGSVYFFLIRNLSTGEIIEKYDNPVTPIVFYINSYTTTNKFVDYIEDSPDEIYSPVFEKWERIKTPNSYDFENPTIHMRSSDEELLKVFR